MVNKEKKIEKPEWLIENEDETWTVKCKKRDYVLEEKEGDVIETCKTLSDKTNTPYENLLVTRSSVKPKLTDADLSGMKGSDYLRLKYAITFVYGLNDF